MPCSVKDYPPAGASGQFCRAAELHKGAKRLYSQGETGYAEGQCFCRQAPVGVSWGQLSPEIRKGKKP